MSVDESPDIQCSETCCAILKANMGGFGVLIGQPPHFFDIQGSHECLFKMCAGNERETSDKIGGATTSWKL
jgi:hypothetical protein